MFQILYPLIFFVFYAYCEETCLHSITQITFPSMGFEKAGEAYFSPGDDAIIFQAVPHGQEHYQIYLMDLQTRIPQMISTGLGSCTCAYFHPDNQKVIFASSHLDPLLGLREKQIHEKYHWDLTPYMNIFEASQDGSSLTPLTSGPAYHAECAYSPDGSEIVYASNEDGSMNLYVMNADGSAVRQITHTTHCYNGGPFFSPNGKKIIFRADREKKDYLQIYCINADGTNEQQITSNGAVNWAPYWHPDGQIIAFTTSLYGHHAYAIQLLNLETKESLRVTYGTSFDGLPVFSHDGKKLLWTSKRGEDGTCQIFMAEINLPDTIK